MRRIVLLALLCLIVSSTASAAPLTLTYQGPWHYYNTCHQEGIPDLDFQCSVDRAFEALGIFVGTPTTLTVTLEPATSFSDGTFSDYGQIFGGQINVGPLTYTIQPANNIFESSLLGPAVIDPLFPNQPWSVPSWQLTDIIFHVPFAQVSGNLLQIDLSPFVTLHSGFGVTSPGSVILSWAHPGLTLIGVSTVSVPEPSTLVTASGALIPLVAMWRWRSRRRKP
jgi:hypothetical protein